MAYIHHTLIHFPIALTLLAALLLVGSSLRPGLVSPPTARLVAYFSALAAIVAMATGLLSAGHAVQGGLDVNRVSLHRNLAIAATAVVVIAAALTWRGARSGAGASSKIGAVGGTIGALAVSVAAHFGGDMVHPGLAPWSKDVHSHGAAGDPGAMGAASADAHRDMAGATDAGEQHAGMAMPSADASTVEGGVDAAGGAAPAPDAGAAPARKPPPPGHGNDHGH